MSKRAYSLFVMGFKKHVTESNLSAVANFQGQKISPTVCHLLPGLNCYCTQRLLMLLCATWDTAGTSLHPHPRQLPDFESVRPQYFFTTSFTAPLKGSHPGPTKEREGRHLQLLHTPCSCSYLPPTPYEGKLLKCPETLGTRVGEDSFSPAFSLGHTASRLCGWESHAKFLSSARSQILFLP